MEKDSNETNSIFSKGKKSNYLKYETQSKPNNDLGR